MQHIARVAWIRMSAIKEGSNKKNADGTLTSERVKSFEQATRHFITVGKALHVFF